MAKKKSKQSPPRKRRTKAEYLEWQRRRTAYHEAGHAIARMKLEMRPFVYVTIVPNGDAHGYIHVVPKKMFDRDSGRLTPRELDISERMLVCTLAGVVAEEVFLNVKLNFAHLYTQADFHDALAAIRHRYPDWQGYGDSSVKGVRHNYFEYVTSRARQIVTCYRREVSAVAEALLDREKLTFAEVQAVISQLPPATPREMLSRMGYSESEVEQFMANQLGELNDGRTPEASGGRFARRVKSRQRLT